MPDTYKEVITIHFANAVARVHIPDLSEEERERRLARIGRAAADLVFSTKSDNDKNHAV